MAGVRTWFSTLFRRGIHGANISQQQKIEILKFANEKGEYQRRPSSFRDSISSEPGAKFAPEKNRYHLYVSYACPWAHRTLIVRELKGLQDILPVSVVHWHMDANGWRFASKDDPCEGATSDQVYGVQRLKELYFKAEPEYEGRFTVPVLWDTKLETVVNNESSEIIRIFNEEFDSIIDEKYRGLTFYPDSLKSKIDEINPWIYDNINNGVYKSGFATKQEPYETNVKALFEHLDKVEKVLGEQFKKGSKYLVGDQLTEADIRLFTTIIRFDPVYVQHFKCNLGMIRFDFPNLHKWVRHLYWEVPGFKETTNFDHIKFHYTKSHIAINPHSITPLGPVPNILPLDA
ncbi:unnamed protein product [Kuraishia capsulata CBS 1993]|uniref:Glutathione S-transferase omega-like 2 n=1 Tax=Kuraishia capsulata CBS 1993 TaxID=1382522 RepID=W6MFZ2_9ASCO|nr:uncharacterized protein KUCA_T00000298001 [Kuraishia capsulata CBS 1993]CDK24338.1 unnamed protein product [Kuraishia capsulata CBS 1993]